MAVKVLMPLGGQKALLLKNNIPNPVQFNLGRNAALQEANPMHPLGLRACPVSRPQLGRQEANTLYPIGFSCPSSFSRSAELLQLKTCSR